MISGANAHSERLDVSRETMERLEILAALLEKWNKRINLVSKSTITNLWARHILDSAQVVRIAPYNIPHWVDIGSGGGFPGLVIAILAAETGSPQRLTMIEADQRKCAFLRTVLRETDVNAKVISQRIEEAPRQQAQVLSARALADLTTLLSYSDRHLCDGGHAILLKGATWKKEIAEARKSWSFTQEVIQSITEPNAVVLKLGEIGRV